MQITIRNKQYTARPTTAKLAPMINLFGVDTLKQTAESQLSEFAAIVLQNLGSREARADLAGCLVDVVGGDIVANDGEILVSYTSRSKFTLELEINEILEPLVLLFGELSQRSVIKPVNTEPVKVKSEAGKGFGDATKRRNIITQLNSLAMDEQEDDRPLSQEEVDEIDALATQDAKLDMIAQSKKQKRIELTKQLLELE